MGRQVHFARRGQQVAADTMTALGKQPQGWDAVKAGIFAGESGGDYNALFGYANRPGGSAMSPASTGTLAPLPRSAPDTPYSLA